MSIILWIRIWEREKVNFMPEFHFNLFEETPLDPPLFQLQDVVISPCVLPTVDSDSLHLLLEKDVVGGIIKMMEALPSHSSAQQVCMYLHFYSRRHVLCLYYAGWM